MEWIILGGIMAKENNHNRVIWIIIIVAFIYSMRGGIDTQTIIGEDISFRTSDLSYGAGSTIAFNTNCDGGDLVQYESSYIIRSHITSGDYCSGTIFTNLPGNLGGPESEPVKMYGGSSATLTYVVCQKDGTGGRYQTQYYSTLGTEPPISTNPLNEIQCPQAPDDTSICEGAGGVWTEFGSACVDNCGSGGFCASVITMGCDCGDSCWDGAGCVSDCTPKTTCDACGTTEPDGCGGFVDCEPCVPICTPEAWIPDPSIVCAGTSFTQANGCDTRTSTGTKTCSLGDDNDDGTVDWSEINAAITLWLAGTYEWAEINEIIENWLG